MDLPYDQSKYDNTEFLQFLRNGPQTKPREEWKFPSDKPYGHFEMSNIIEFLDFISNNKQIKICDVWEEWKVAIKQFLLMNGKVLFSYGGYVSSHPRFPKPDTLAIMIYQVKINYNARELYSEEEHFMMSLWDYVHHGPQTKLPEELKFPMMNLWDYIYHGPYTKLREEWTFSMDEHYDQFDMSNIIKFLDFIANNKEIKICDVWEDWKVTINQFLLMDEKVLAFYKQYRLSHIYFPYAHDLAIMIYQTKSNYCARQNLSEEEHFMENLWYRFHI